MNDIVEHEHTHPWWQPLAMIIVMIVCFSYLFLLDALLGKGIADPDGSGPAPKE